MLTIQKFHFDQHSAIYKPSDFEKQYFLRENVKTIQVTSMHLKHIDNPCEYVIKLQDTDTLPTVIHLSHFQGKFLIDKDRYILNTKLNPKFRIKNPLDFCLEIHTEEKSFDVTLYYSIEKCPKQYDITELFPSYKIL